MSKCFLLLFSILPLVYAPAAQADEPVPRLAGARRAIDASNYNRLQDAFDAIGDEGGVVHLPAGTFEITEPLTVTTGDVMIEGVGGATHIVNKNEEGKPAILLASPDKKVRLWRICVANLRITGNPKSGSGIEADRINEIFCTGITLTKNGKHGILLNDCYENPRICQSMITYNGASGLDVNQCHDIVVAANHFEENLDALSCRDSFNLTMTGNNVDDHLRNGVVIENTYGSVLSGNMIEECKGTAVILDRDCYGITVSANVFAHNDSGGVDLRDAHGCAISANTFTLVKKNAVIVREGSGRITLSANNFCGSYIGDRKDRRKPGDRAATGITLDGASDIVISANAFVGLSSPGIVIGEKKPHRVLVRNNAWRDAGKLPTELASPGSKADNSPGAEHVRAGNDSGESP